MKNSVIIAAGGSGSRLNIDGGKQFLLLAGKPVVVRSILFFQQHPAIQEIIVVTAEKSREMCADYVTTFQLTKVRHIITSGDSRQQSVANGLAAIMDADNVLIHDGARPLMKPDYIDRIIVQLKDYDGAIIAVPVTDTIKQVSAGVVEKTLDRRSLVSVQTPQGFRFSKLREAYLLPDKERFTDDSSMIEAIGGRVVIVPGDPENIKITHRPDLILADKILSDRET